MIAKSVFNAHFPLDVFCVRLSIFTLWLQLLQKLQVALYRVHSATSTRRPLPDERQGYRTCSVARMPVTAQRGLV